MQKIVLAAAAALLATPAAAGPFGIKMGAALKDLKVIDKVDTTSPIKAYTVSVPQPNSEFDSYMVMLTSETGVCKILAIGKTNESDRYGSSVRASFIRLKGALTQKYGTSEDFDYLSAGALWKNSEDFAASLDKNERTLSSFWMDVADPGNEVKNVELQAKGIDLTDTYVTLSYELKNTDQCRAFQDKADNSGL